MNIGLGRSIIVAATAELGTYAVWILVLIAAGLIIGNPTQTRWFAYLFGQSVGIFAGFLLCVFAGRWVARASDHPIKSGLIVGAICAALNALIVIAKTTQFPPILLVGSFGRVLGGCLGGWLVRNRVKRENAREGTTEP